MKLGFTKKFLKRKKSSYFYCIFRNHVEFEAVLWNNGAPWEQMDEGVVPQETSLQILTGEGKQNILSHLMPHSLPIATIRKGKPGTHIRLCHWLPSFLRPQVEKGQSFLLFSLLERFLLPLKTQKEALWHYCHRKEYHFCSILWWSREVVIFTKSSLHNGLDCQALILLCDLTLHVRNWLCPLPRLMGF